MPPLKYYPEAFRSGPSDDDYTSLQMRLQQGELKRIDLDGEAIFYTKDDDMEMITTAYTMETNKSIYVTQGPEGWHSPEHRPPKKGWLKKILGI